MLIQPGRTVPLTLPWPPTANHYYRHVGPRVLISRQGREYRDLVVKLVREHSLPRLHGWIGVEMDLCPPDRRRRDIDNLLKPILDSLQHAGIFADDFAVDDLHLRRRRDMVGLSNVGMSIREIGEN